MPTINSRSLVSRGVNPNSRSLVAGRRARPEQRPQLNTVADFQKFAQGNRQSGLNTIAFGGGFLSPTDFNRAQFLEKEELTADFETKQAEARAANEERYADILAQYGRTIEGATARGPQLLEFDEEQFIGLGDQAKKDIAQTYTNLEAAGTQNLVSSGLAGTTARGAVTAASARGRTQATGALNESLRRERISYGSEIDRFNATTRQAYSQYLDSLTAQKLSFQERREDEGPDQAIFLQQLEKFGNV